jgi:hypothetical protein
MTQIIRIISDAFQDADTTSVVGGWLECSDEEHFEAYLFIVEASADGQALNGTKIQSQK